MSTCSTTCTVNGLRAAGAWLFCLFDDMPCQWITSGRCVVVLSVGRLELSMDHERQVRSCSVCATTCTVNGSRAAGAWLFCLSDDMHCQWITSGRCVVVCWTTWTVNESQAAGAWLFCLFKLRLFCLFLFGLAKAICIYVRTYTQSIKPDFQQGGLHTFSHTVRWCQ